MNSFLGVDDATTRTVLASWGPGKFDAELFLDGKAFRPDGKTAATLIPAAFGLAGVNLHTYTGWGSVPHWNAFVANLEMHGKGTFFDPRLNDAAQFPVAARARSGHTQVAEARTWSPRSSGRCTSTSSRSRRRSRRPAASTPPPPGAEACSSPGRRACASCHAEPLTTEPGWNMHTPEEIGIDDFQASRAPDERYRTTPLDGLFTRSKGGFYHDGRFATLLDVVNHYDSFRGLALTPAEKSDLVEYLKSL